MKQIAKPEHEVAYKELAEFLKKVTDEHNLSALELLAITSNMLGKLLAMQDQRTITPAEAMEVVTNNIMLGNQQVVDILTAPTVGSA